MPKKRRRSTKRQNPPRRHYTRTATRRRRRHYRRNPAGFSVNGLMKSAMNGVVDGAYGVAGKAATRAVAGMLGMNEGIVGYLVQAGLGVVGGALVHGFSKEGARAFVQGAMMGPIESVVASANIPVISAQLSGYNNFILPTAYNAGLLSPGPAVGMQGYPPSYAGYPPSPAMLGDFDSAAESYGR